MYVSLLGALKLAKAMLFLTLAHIKVSIPNTKVTIAIIANFSALEINRLIESIVNVT